IDTSRVILWTWILAAGFAGLAGVLYGATTQLQPDMGVELLLPIFAVVVLGGIGNAFGALAAGVLLGVVIEWSTLVFDERWKFAIGFVILILVLVIRPQGIFGKARTV
ncbi:MAG: branched-chain amino acid ABC transporter permease, partial [Solirubrobacterales bacterium]